jgi:hypothetical protein
VAERECLRWPTELKHPIQYVASDQRLGFLRFRVTRTKSIVAV